MAYTVRYRLTRAPEATTDGSKMVRHDIVAIALDNDDPGAEWVVVQGYHKTINIPAEDLAALVQQPNWVNLYKNAVYNNRGTIPESISGWKVDQIKQRLENNDVAQAAALAAIDRLPNNYPIDFDLPQLT